MTTKATARTSVIFIVLLLSGCSTFSFVFERLDWFTLWRLDSMFDLNEEQEELIKPDLIAIQEWMRLEAFPSTINKLGEVLELWEADKPEQAYLHLISSMDNLNHFYLKAMEDGVVKFSLRLTEENAQHYREYSNDKQKDWFESAQSTEARIDHETERLEEWFGRLSDEQIKLIENWASVSDNELQIRIDNHISWRDKYLQTAINRDEALLRDWLKDLSIFWTPEYTQLKQHNQQQRQNLLFQLFPSLSDKQKRHARKHVESWIEKLQDVLPES